VDESRELADDALLLDEIAARLRLVRDDLNPLEQQLLVSAASSIHAAAALLRSLGFTKRRRLMKAKAASTK
jgi:hypothetical protein